MFEKVLETSHTACFTMIIISLVHSGNFNLVRRKTNLLHYESLDNSILQSLPGTAEITGFMRKSISAVHSASLRPLRVYALYDARRVFSVISDMET